MKRSSKIVNLVKNKMSLNILFIEINCLFYKKFSTFYITLINLNNNFVNFILHIFNKIGSFTDSNMAAHQ